MKKLMAASVFAISLVAPAGTAWAGGYGGSLINVGDVEVIDDVCTNVNINLGVEKNKNQEC